MEEPGHDWPRSWDDWSRRDRDRKERAALKVAVRARRAQAGFAHEAATRAYHAACRRAAIATAALAVPVTTGWVLVLRARDASLAEGLGDRAFVPSGFALLVVTVVLLVVVLGWWTRALRARPYPLRLEVDPDSPTAPRHRAFDGTHRPPPRW